MTPAQLAAAMAAVTERLTVLTERQDALSRRMDDVRDELDALNSRLEAASTRRRRPKVQVVSEINVCGLHPEIDSGVCPSANVYRFQQGCLGTSCVEKNRQYYADRRARKRAEQQA